MVGCKRKMCATPGQLSKSRAGRAFQTNMVSSRAPAGTLLLAAMLRPDSSGLGGVRHPPDGQDVSSGPHVNAVLFRRAVHVVKSAYHDLLQPAVHVVLVPPELLQVLHPFEVG